MVEYNEDKDRRRRKGLLALLAAFLAACVAAFAVLLVVSTMTLLKRLPRDPLCASIVEDSCYENGVFCIYSKMDYGRFAGYMNRAKEEREEGILREGEKLTYEEVLSVGVRLMADIDMNDEAVYGSHPYIRQGIYRYRGDFNGNGHTIIWFDETSNGMFVVLEREARVHDFTLQADRLAWSGGKYGIGMVCMVNYGCIEQVTAAGSVETENCYAGGIAGINRGTIRDCVNRARVRVTGVGDYGAGGIAGLSKCKVLEGESDENPIVPVIEDCLNYGSVEGTWAAGGICAYNDCAHIYRCGNEGPVTVQYQRGYIYPDEPEYYTNARAAGICGYMGWNNLMDCYNTGRITIAEEGIWDTYGIAGDTLDWTSSVTGCVSLKGSATGHMRHESVMELSAAEMELWKENPQSVPYVANNWQFDLEEAKKKLPIAPLNVKESPLTKERKDVYLCESFFLSIPEGFVMKEVSPYALCMEEDGQTGTGTEKSGRQVWILRLAEGTDSLNDNLDEEGYITEDSFHGVWLDIPGAHWLHPGPSMADDCHVERVYGKQLTRYVHGANTWLLHYRDDILARMAVGEENGEMSDNISAFPVRQKADGSLETQWLLLFTNGENNYRPSRDFVQHVMERFRTMPFAFTVRRGDSLSRIAWAVMGDGSCYPELAAYNGLDVDERLLPGQILYLPEEWLVEEE